MRTFIRIKVLVLGGIALLLIGLHGCSPGPIVWRVDTAPLLRQQTEASQ